MKNKDIVIQNNDLISGRHNWSANEIKIVLKSITELKEDKLIVCFSKSEILKILGDVDLNIRELKSISKKLSSKIFEIQNDNNDWKILTWFSEIEYKQGVFSIEYNYKMKDYLLNLKKNFTKFNIQNILPMKSNYSMRIYQLLKQYQKIKYRRFKIDDLRELLKVPNSYTILNFRKNVILKAQEEMKQYSDITFEFKEIKTSRKITDIEFIIHNKQDNKDIIEENPWYYTKYYDKNIIQSEIEYKCITDIIEKNNILIVTFKDGDSIKVKDEDALIQILVD